MNRKLEILAIFLLIFIGLSALWGGYMLISDPTGKSMQFPIDYLGPTIFSDYLIPGLILFLMIGVLSLAVALLVINRAKNYFTFILLQGSILLLWLSGELLFNFKFYEPRYHIPLYLAGVVLIGIGVFISWDKKAIKNNHV